LTDVFGNSPETGIRPYCTGKSSSISRVSGQLGAAAHAKKSHPMVAMDFVFGCFSRLTVAIGITLVRAHCCAVEQLFSF
jgi:hypothetical protein